MARRGPGRGDGSLGIVTVAAQTGLEQIVADGMREMRVPGVAVGLLHDGIEETFCFGVTSVENPLAVDSNTLFQIGSITKTFTATLLMQLVSQGRLDINAPIRSVLPDFQLQDEDVAGRATPRHVLTHTGGWVGDEFLDTGDGDNALQLYVKNMRRLPQIAPLGELFSYCNSGFSVGGRIVEVLTGKTFECAAYERLIEPLGMARSFLAPAEVMTYRFAVGHNSPFSDSEAITVLRPWPLARAANSAGGLSSTVVDMLKYARLHLGLLGNDVLDAHQRAAMQEPWGPGGDMADAIGAAWMLNGPADRRVVGHGGSTNGQQATLQLAPSRSFAVVVLTNGSRGGDLNGRIAAWALEKYVGISQPKPITYRISPEKLTEFVGHYDQVLNSIELDAADGGLVVQMRSKGGFPTKNSPPRPPTPPARFEFFAEDRILGLEPRYAGSRGDFLRGPDGRIHWLRLGGRIGARQ